VTVPATPEPYGLAEVVRFQRDLYVYWHAVHTVGSVALTSRGLVTRPALRGLRARFAALDGLAVSDADSPEPEDLRLFFLRRLLQRLGLLRVEGERLVARERADMARYLDHPLAERVRLAVRLWTAGGWWPDRPDASAAPPRLMTPAPPRIALARRRLVLTLAALAPGELVPVPAEAVPASARSTRTPASRRRQDGARSGDTRALDAATRRAALLGPLRWMGIVTPEPAEAHRESRWCRVGVAAAALRPEDGNLPPLDEQPGRIVVQPNFELIAYPPLTALLLLFLDGCAEELAREQLARYRLTRASLAGALRLGLPAVALVERLEALSGQPLPSNVGVTLADWERQSARLRVTEQVTLLEVREPALLDALLADRAAAGWVERRLGPSRALLAAAAAPAVRAWLLRHGELPALRDIASQLPAP
jgi:hypothetical protein